MVKHTFFILFIAMFFAAVSVKAQQPTPVRVNLSGVITDSISGEPIEFMTLQEKGTTNGTITNLEGAFHLIIRSNSTLVVSCVGYRTKEIRVGSKSEKVHIQVVPNDYQLSEVVVKPKREHYRRRNNPSVELAKNVIEHRNDHPLSDHDYYEAQRIERTTYSFNNFTGALYKGWKQKFPKIDNYIDTAFSGSKILPVSSDEKVERIYYRRKPNSLKTVLEGQRHVGLDEMLPADVVSKAQTECFPEIDLDETSIYLFSNKFVNPLSKLGLGFYKYYILDTLAFDDGKRYIDLAFAPLVSQTFGFIGHLYVSTDSTYFVKRLDWGVPPDINVNFVKNMHFVLEQDRLPDGTQFVVSKSFESEMNVIDVTSGLFAQREMRYGNYRFDAPSAEVEKTILDANAPYLETPELGHRNAEFWHEAHAAVGDISRTEQVEVMLREMRERPFLKWSERILTWLFKGYVPTNYRIPLDENRFLYGPVTATASYNEFEGIRLRTGGCTTAYFNPHWYFSGWAAYGLKDNEWKGDARIEYSFKPKKNHFNEFPIHGLRLEYNYDTKFLNLDPEASHDNFFLSVKRDDADKIAYERRFDLTYIREFYGGFSYQLRARMMRHYSTSLAPFYSVGQERFLPYYDLSYATLKLRYAPHETFMQMRVNRVNINHEHPIFQLQHSYAGKGILGSDFDFQRTDFQFDKRFWLSAFGYIDCQLKGGKVWTQSPYAMLVIPYANTGYTVQKYSFSQMNAMEFVSDQYAQWDLVYYLNGWVFNTIPLFKKLKWREVVSFRGYYGTLSDKNNPAARMADGVTLRNPDLFRLPTDKPIYTEMDRGPYMEAAVGIENIFKILRIDYIRRLNYLDHENVVANGVQISAHVTF